MRKRKPFLFRSPRNGALLAVGILLITLVLWKIASSHGKTPNPLGSEHASGHGLEPSQVQPMSLPGGSEQASGGGYSVVSESQGAEVGGLFITSLDELLDALSEGAVSDQDASKCVFLWEAQGNARVNYAIGQYAVCGGPAGAGMVEFALIPNGERTPLTGDPIRFVGRKTFTTRNGTVRVMMVFESMANFKTERSFDDSQFEAIKPN